MIRHKTKPVLAVDINLTNMCNFRCRYCFEYTKFQKSNKSPYKISLNQVQFYIDFFKHLQKSQWFKQTFSGLQLDMWGGEPTLVPEAITAFYDAFKDDPTVVMWIFTNGSNIHSIEPIIKDSLYRSVNCGSRKEKLWIQVSFDGNPIHDLYRIDSNMQPTSNIVKQTIRFLAKLKVPFGVKAVVPSDAIQYMSDAYLDYLQLSDEIGRPLFYNPSLDYWDDDTINLDKLFSELIKISAIIYKTRRNQFSWFIVHSRALCASGSHMFFLDNNNFYVCHGAKYSPFPDIFKVTTLTDNFNQTINDLQSTSNYFLDLLNKALKHPICSHCNVDYCTRCFITRFIHSNKTTFEDRWLDFTSQPNLCKSYKLITKVRHSLEELMR